MQIALILVLLTSSITFAADNMKAFPPADEGMIRYVLQLEQKEDESMYRVELIVGKTVLLDEVNQYFLGGAIESEVIVVWGFTRYVVNEIGPMAGTLKAVPPDAKKVQRFIGLGGDPYLIRYNSRLPVVVYVPEGAEVRYRIWSGAKESVRVTKG